MTSRFPSCPLQQADDSSRACATTGPRAVRVRRTGTLLPARRIVIPGKADPAVGGEQVQRLTWLGPVFGSLFPEFVDKWRELPGGEGLIVVKNLDPSQVLLNPFRFRYQQRPRHGLFLEHHLGEPEIFYI